jgi:hypothetical protein
VNKYCNFIFREEIGGVVIAPYHCIGFFPMEALVMDLRKQQKQSEMMQVIKHIFKIHYKYDREFPNRTKGKRRRRCVFPDNGQ